MLAANRKLDYMCIFFTNFDQIGWSTSTLTSPISNGADADAPVVVLGCVSSHSRPSSSLVDESVSSNAKAATTNNTRKMVHSRRLFLSFVTLIALPVTDVPPFPVVHVKVLHGSHGFFALSGVVARSGYVRMMNDNIRHWIGHVGDVLRISSSPFLSRDYFKGIVFLVWNEPNRLYTWFVPRFYVSVNLKKKQILNVWYTGMRPGSSSRDYGCFRTAPGKSNQII